jgi:23S rRNA pseudouridine2605 synthase
MNLSFITVIFKRFSRVSDIASITRINKALSMLGICSRRDADLLVARGLVLVNGVVVTNLGTKVMQEDRIEYNGKEYSLKDDSQRSETRSKVWLYYKKRGLIVSHRCERNRPTIFEDVRNKIRERVISVGRLDLDSEGLIILTNNGDFARYAESPRTGWARVYSVKFYGKLTKNMVNEIEEGICIDGFRYAPIKVATGAHHNNWCSLTLCEGKNREIRKIFSNFGLVVNRLIRIQYGPYKLNNLDIGDVIETKLPTSFC